MLVTELSVSNQRASFAEEFLIDYIILIVNSQVKKKSGNPNYSQVLSEVYTQTCHC